LTSHKEISSSPSSLFRQIESSVSATMGLQRLNCAFATVNVALPKVMVKPGFAL
jgi:hypothetical protein